jgi:hypothetical protein
VHEQVIHLLIIFASSVDYADHGAGLMALPRSPLHAPSEDMEKEAEDVVDASTLPPG